jgi:hypothetical protein
MATESVRSIASRHRRERWERCCDSVGHLFFGFAGPFWRGMRTRLVALLENGSRILFRTFLRAHFRQVVMQGKEVSGLRSHDMLDSVFVTYVKHFSHQCGDFIKVLFVGHWHGASRGAG